MFSIESPPRPPQARPEHDEVEDVNVPHVDDEVTDEVADLECQRCGYSSNLESDLAMHAKSAHAHAKSIMCDRCPYFTEEEKDFKEHVVSAHGSAGDDKVEEEESECILGY